MAVWVPSSLTGASKLIRWRSTLMPFSSKGDDHQRGDGAEEAAVGSCESGDFQFEAFEFFGDLEGFVLDVLKTVRCLAEVLGVDFARCLGSQLGNVLRKVN